MKLKLKIAAEVVSESGSDVNQMQHLYLTHSGITDSRTYLDMLPLLPHFRAGFDQVAIQLTSAPTTHRRGFKLGVGQNTIAVLLDI